MKNPPKLLSIYLIKEFSLSLFIFFGIFIALIILTTYLEEIVYFRDLQSDKGFFIKILFLTLIKVPTLIISLSPFIFLFTGIFFFVKLLNRNEIFPLNQTGLSNNFVIIIPSIFSFIFGVLLIAIFTPVSSELLKIYETTKQKYNKNENLIIINNTGTWLKANSQGHKYLIRFDNIQNENFNELKNISIYKFGNNMSFLERIDSDTAKIKEASWILNNYKKINDQKNERNKVFEFKNNIDLNILKRMYRNSNIFSVWNIRQKLKILNETGYYGQEFIITFNKYLSLPFMLFGMIVISTFFTLNLNKRFNIFVYSFLGTLLGILVYFLNDASIALGKAGRMPLTLSVWMPVFIIMLVSVYSLMKTNETKT